MKLISDETYARIAHLTWNELAHEYEKISDALAGAQVFAIELKAENDAFRLRTGICEWEYDSLDDKWNTFCSNSWQFFDGGPKANNCQYCMYCGGVIETIQKEAP